MEKKSIIIHAYKWDLISGSTEDGNQDVIHAWCLDRNSESYLLRFEDFPAFCHVELPMYIKGMKMQWNEKEMQIIYIMQFVIIWEMINLLLIIYKYRKRKSLLLQVTTKISYVNINVS